MQKVKGILKVTIVLFYILLLGDMICNNERYFFKDEWLFWANIVLLAIGFYAFVQHNIKNK